MLATFFDMNASNTTKHSPGSKPQKHDRGDKKATLSRGRQLAGSPGGHEGLGAGGASNSHASRLHLVGLRVEEKRKLLDVLSKVVVVEWGPAGREAWRRACARVFGVELTRSCEILGQSKTPGLSKMRHNQYRFKRPTTVTWERGKLEVSGF